MATSGWIKELRHLAAEQPSAMTLRIGEPLAKCSTLRIGGPAESLVDVGTATALQAVLDLRCRHQLPLMILGKGANVLFPDQGLAGLVCRLVGEFREFEIDALEVRAGAGVVLAQLARHCAKRGLVGLEALAGFPASVGGAVTMNAGCYGTEISDLLIKVNVLERRLSDADGGSHYSPKSLDVAELEAGYRSTALSHSGAIVLDAIFRLKKGDPTEALEQLDTLNRRRWASLPSGKPNAGSTFRNPPGDFAGRLLDQAGVKGLRIGDAALSEKHANVIVNLGSARAVDVVEVMRSARDRVSEQSGVVLVPELILSEPLDQQYERVAAHGTSADDG